MATAAKPTAARAMSTPPATLLDQNIGSAMENFWLRMGPAMISQTPSSALPAWRPANPRGFASLQLGSALLGVWLIIAGPILSQKYAIADPMFWSNSLAEIGRAS